jgi:REP element-mobilizing transposase RayT
VADGEMHLSPQGQIVSDEWVKTGRIRPSVTLDEWVVMPNHLHGIVIMAEASGGPHGETPRRGVSTTWKPGVLGAIIGQFKSNCTKRIRSDGYPGFAWQPRYYDHIIRDEGSLARIREYIAGNPLKWPEDDYHIDTPAPPQAFRP